MATVLVGILVFFAAALVGLWLKKRLVKRADFYRAYYDYLTFALEKISYERTPIDDIVRDFHSESAEFTDMLRGDAASAPLSDDKKLAVKGYLDSIGTTDAETQIASLRAKIAEVKKVLDEDAVKWRKDGTVYFKLCVLIGVALFIILA